MVEPSKHLTSESTEDMDTVSTEAILLEIVSRVKLAGGQVWDIVQSNGIATMVPVSEGKQVNEDTIEIYLRKNGFKNVQKISEYTVSFDQVMPRCNRCHSNKNVIKRGRQTQTPAQHKRYFCKSCNYRFTVDRK